MFWLKEKQNGQDKQRSKFIWQIVFFLIKTKNTQTPISNQQVNKMDPNLSPLFAL